MDRNFYRFLDHFSTSTFFSAGENKFSYNLFKIEVNKKAKTLKDKDVKEGDFVGLKVKNPFEFFVTLFALWKIKAIAVPFSDKMPKENILKWSQDLPLALIIHNQEKYENVETNSIFFDKKNTLVSGVVILTSGSSGPPKGVLLTEENLFYSALGTNQFYNILPEDQWGLTLPHHHIAGLMIPLRCLLAGASVTLKEPQQPLPLFIQETKPTYLSVVPHQVKDMLDFKVKKEENKKSFSSLKAILVGGAFLSLQLKKRAKKESLPLSPTFGLTEMASQVTAQRPQDFLKDSPSDHFGHLLPFRKMAFDKDHKILLGGKTSFSGYLTKQKLIQPPYSDKFPNLWQGQDQGQYDQNLRLILKGRHDKVFISGGENINPLK